MAQYEAATANDQTFKDGSGNNISAPGVLNTGSDYIRYYTGSPAKSLLVSVWDGTYPTLAWQHITAGGTTVHGSMPLSSSNSSLIPEDPDVALLYRKVSGTDYMYALVCYRDQTTSDIYYETFHYDFSTDAFSVTNQSLINGSAVTGNNSVNMDCDQFEHWAITYDSDDGNGNAIYYAAGNWNTGTNAPGQCAGGVKLSDPRDAGGSPYPRPYLKPDICVYSSTAYSTNASATFTFTSDNGDILLTVTQRMSALCGNTSINTSPDQALTAASGFVYDWPRIAAHKDQSAYSYFQDGYCAVYEYYSSSLDEIGGITKFTDFTNTSSPVTTYHNRIYTDGSEYFYNQSSIFLPTIDNTTNFSNASPVVTYDAKSGNIIPEPNGKPINLMIGWVSKELNVSKFKPIVIYVDNAFGQPYNSLNPAVYDFHEVPKTVTNDQAVLSMAAEQSPNIHYCWYESTADRIKYKIKAPGAHLRGPNNETFENGNETLNSFFQTDCTACSWQVYASDGKLLKKGMGSFSLQNFLAGLEVLNFNPRLNLVRMQDENGQHSTITFLK